MDYITPQGFRDVLPSEARAREIIEQEVQAAFASAGYEPIETPSLEMMSVLEAGGRIPGSPFKFFDAQGDLLAMRPDVTLQVARMCATRLKSKPGPFRFRYKQRVYREAAGLVQAAAREQTQIGIECIGEEGPRADAEVITLLAEALKITGVSRFTLSLATVGVLRALLEASGAGPAWVQAILDAFHDSNFVEIDTLTDAGYKPEGSDAKSFAPAAPVFASAIRSLPRIRGSREAIDKVRDLVAPLGCEDGLDDFEKTYDLLVDAGLESCLMVDFSVMSSFDYYTGIVFQANSFGFGRSLGSGGRYDKTLGAYGEDRPAAGFAFFLEETMAAASFESDQDRPLRIAIPKGSLNADTIATLEAAGLDVTGLDNPGRMLIISNPGVDYIIVRPTDAPVFVETGAADCGICGEDSLLEANPDVIELVDLNFGSCRFVVAEPDGSRKQIEDHYEKLGSIRVATKYPRITAAYYAKAGTQVEIVKLHGNIELAPLTGIAERIVDITATGTTLRENNLVVVDEVLSSTARFFANTCAFRTDARIQDLAEKLAACVSKKEG